MLLAVADGSDSQEAARAAGRTSGDAVSHLVARFNCEGLAAPDPRRGHKPTYDASAQARILREAVRTPTPDAAGTATWSLATRYRGSSRRLPFAHGMRPRVRHLSRPAFTAASHRRRIGRRWKISSPACVSAPAPRRTRRFPHSGTRHQSEAGCVYPEYRNPPLSARTYPEVRPERDNEPTRYSL